MLPDYTTGYNIRTSNLDKFDKVTEECFFIDTHPSTIFLYTVILNSAIKSK